MEYIDHTAAAAQRFCNLWENIWFVDNDWYGYSRIVVIDMGNTFVVLLTLANTVIFNTYQL